ncbi:MULTISPECIES: FeoA family protein [Ruminococcus]|uniref:Ferrous iron transport protein A n=1 Tax=Ruminococcus flavefaciens TaxID=1265 RepID=A0A1M7LAP5_RUMFL|nr:MULTISPECIES: FeoA family protein [Ruminococcus]MCR4793582.1 ferrous iron transport protein A [Ruminococcus sp.]SHM75052.1 ferrous iron transport protein A [Ruminococcus flavefaciens]
MNYHIPMCTLDEGQLGEVVGISLNGHIRSRLADLGLIQGCRVKCLQKSFGGDIAAYLICGAVIAVRKCDAARVSCRII